RAGDAHEGLAESRPLQGRRRLLHLGLPHRLQPVRGPAAAGGEGAAAHPRRGRERPAGPRAACRRPSPRPALRARARRGDGPAGARGHSRFDPRSPGGHTPARVGRALLRGDQPGARLSEGDGDEPSALRAPPAPAAPAGAPVSTERALTCGDAADLLDAFVDAELPAPTLLAVARHAGGCAACDAAIRELTAVSQMAGRRLAAEVEGLDLGRVWPAVSRGIELADARAAWRRRVRSVPAWGVALAAAASALFWLRAPGPDPLHIARVR